MTVEINKGNGIDHITYVHIFVKGDANGLDTEQVTSLRCGHHILSVALFAGPMLITEQGRGLYN